MNSTELATDLLDNVLPRKAPEYPLAHAYVVAYLDSNASIRRLAMKALRNHFPDTEHDHAAPPAAGGAPASGEYKEGAAPRHADGDAAVRDAQAPATAAVQPAGTQSGQPRLWCHGKACEIRPDGKEHHIPDPSCSKLSPGRRIAR